MTLYQLKVFVLVAKLKGVTLAAEELEVRQPSVTLLMQGLQKELGVKLYEKLGHKLHLTGAGEEFLRCAEEILCKVDGIKEAMEEISGLKKGRISVGSAGIGSMLLLPAVQEFKRRHPGIDVSLTIQGTQILHRKLLDGELDVAILGRPPQSPLILGEPYHEEKIVVIAPPKHPLTKKRSVPLKLLAEQSLISYEKGSLVADMIERRFAEAGLPFKPQLELNLQLGTRDAVKSAVASGLGISFLSQCHVLSEVKAGRVKILHVPELNLKRTIYIAVHKNRQSSSLIQTFIDFLKHYKQR